MTPLMRMMMMSGGGSASDPGELLLQQFLAWGSADDQTTVTESAPVTLQAAAASTFDGGEADPFGGATAYNFSDDTGTSQHYLRFSPPAGVANGAVYMLEFFYLPVHATRALLTVGANNVDKLYNFNHASLYIGKGSGTDWIRAEMREIGGGWLRYRGWFVADDDPRLRIYASNAASYTGAGETIGHLTMPTYTRISVSAQANLVAGSSATISQGTAASRPNVDLAVWPGETPAIIFDGHGGTLTVSDIHADLSGDGQPWTAFFLLEPRTFWGTQTTYSEGPLLTMTGATASLVVTQTATGIDVDRTNDAAASESATMPLSWVHGLPQVAALVYDGADVQLYVNGSALGSAQALNGGVATFTSVAIGGGGACRLKDWALSNQALDAGQVASVSSRLASLREVTTAPVPLWFGVGQSNSSARGDMGLIDLEDAFPPGIAGSIVRAEDVEAPTNNSQSGWDFVRPRNVAWNPPLQYADTETRYSWSRTFAKDFGRCAVTQYWRGGTSLHEFLTGGTYAAGMIAEFQDAIDDLVAGGIAYDVAGLVVIAGEANVNNETQTNAYAGWVETLRSELESEFSITLPVVLVPQLHTTVGGTYAAQLRTNLLAWQTADPSARKLIATTGLSLDGDNVHWNDEMVLAMGERFAAQGPLAE